MRPYHYICFNTSAEQVANLQGLGVFIKAKNSAAVSIYDDDPRWPEVRNLLTTWHVKWRDHFEYSEEDHRAAAYLCVNGALEVAYPQPEKDSAWKAATYDLSKYCGSCGSHKVQVNPFKLSEALKFGSKDFVSIYWVYDEFFVRKEIWERVFQPFGIASLPVLHEKTGKPFEAVVQLKIETVSPYGLKMPESWKSSNCGECAQLKYYGDSGAAFFPLFREDSCLHMFRTQEVFGAG